MRNGSLAQLKHGESGGGMLKSDYFIYENYFKF